MQGDIYFYSFREMPVIGCESTEYNAILKKKAYKKMVPSWRMEEKDEEEELFGGMNDGKSVLQVCVSCSF